MPEIVFAWPTIIGIDHLGLSDVTNANLQAAALLVEKQARPKDDPRHFASTVDNHLDIFPAAHRTDLDTLWTAVVGAMRRYLSGGFGFDSPYPFLWSLSILVARAGNRLAAHTHPQRDLFAAYYPHVDPAEEDRTGLNGGELRVMDSRGWARKWLNRNPAMFDAGCLSLRPKAGMLVIAPGYALHETNPFSGPGLRVTYGFFVNLQMEREYGVLGRAKETT